MNYRMLIQYDGTRYNGWQRQATTAQTIQGKIEEVLSRMLDTPVEIQGAGRTDSGVHALGQVANVQLKTEKSPEDIRTYLNLYLPEDIGVAAVEIASDRFHSRLNAAGKTYCYRLATNPALHVLERKYMQSWETPLDLPAMRQAAALLIGEHGFQSFCQVKMKKSSIRRLDKIEIRSLPGELRITYEGSGFLNHMARILTGTLLEVGSGDRNPESMPETLAARSRQKAGAAAPAKGLTLMEVRYS